jgi:hypothetical protein
MFLYRVSGTLVVPKRITLPKDVVRQEANHVYSKDYGHGGKGDGNGVPPGRRQGHGRRTLHLSLNPQKGTMKRRMKMERSWK